MTSSTLKKQPLSEILEAVAVEIEHQHTASLALQRLLSDILHHGKKPLTSADISTCQDLDKLSQSLAYLSSYIGDLAVTVSPNIHATIKLGSEGDTFVSMHKRLISTAHGSEDDDIEIFAKD